MRTTPRFRLALAALGALAVVDACVWVLVVNARDTTERQLDWETWAGADDDADDAYKPLLATSGGAPTDSGRGERIRRSGSAKPVAEALPPIGLAEARALLAAALERRPLDWRKVGDLLERRGDALDESLVAAMLAGLVERPEGRDLIAAFSHAKHPTLAGLLLDLAIDHEPRTPTGAIALEALGHLPEMDRYAIVKRVNDRLLAHDTSQDLPWLRTLAGIGGEDALDAVVAYLARATDPDKLLPATWRAFVVDDLDAAAARIRSALADARDPAERRALASLVAELRPPGLVPELVEMARDGADPALQATAFQALAAIGTSDAVHMLVDEGRNTGRAAELARSVMGRLGGRTALDTESLAALRAGLGESVRGEASRELSHVVMAALAAQRDVEALPAVASAVEDGHEETSLRAIQSLGTYGALARAEVGPLVERYPKSSERTQQAIAAALGNIGGGEAIEALVRFYDGTRPNAALAHVLQQALRRARTVGAQAAVGAQLALGG